MTTGWWLRHRLKWQMAADLGLFTVALGLAVAAGFTARVVDAEGGAVSDRR